MIYDTFLFFDELDLLEIRLHELSDVVDTFVLVESYKTFTNQPKPLYYLANKERFKNFDSRIIHIIVDDFDDLGVSDPWSMEIYQRRCILRGLQKCKPYDTIMLSDIDEIPRANVVKEYYHKPGVKTFEQTLYYYHLNCTGGGWYGTRMFKYRDLMAISPDLQYYRETTQNLIKNAGWHFSYIGGVKAIQRKIASYAHSELNRFPFNNQDYIRTSMSQKRDIFRRNIYRFKIVQIDDTFPKHVQDNYTRYLHLIRKDQ